MNKLSIIVELEEDMENIRGIKKYIALSGKTIIGEVITGKPNKNMFWSLKKEGEIEIFKAEGKEEAIDFIINHLVYESWENKEVLFVRDIDEKGLEKEKLTEFGFIYEPVLYHQTAFVFGEKYLCNLDNIEEECHSFLYI